MYYYVIGAVIFGGVLVIIVRHFVNGTDYGYDIPETGAWGRGQESPSHAMDCAERSIKKEQGVGK